MATVQSLINNSLNGSGSLSDAAPHVSSIQSNITAALATAGLSAAAKSQLQAASAALKSGNNAAAKSALQAAASASSSTVAATTTAAKTTTTTTAVKTATQTLNAGSVPVTAKAPAIMTVASSSSSSSSSSSGSTPSSVTSLIKNSLSGTGSLSDSSPHISSIQSNITKALATSGISASTKSNLQAAQSALASGNTSAAASYLSAASGGSVSAPAPAKTTATTVVTKTSATTTITTPTSTTTKTVAIAPVAASTSVSSGSVPSSVSSLIKNSLSGTGSLSDSSPHVSSIQSNITKALATSGISASTKSNLQAAQSALSSGNTAAAASYLSAASGGSVSASAPAKTTTPVVATSTVKASTTAAASTAAVTAAKAAVTSAQAAVTAATKASSSGTNQYGMTSSQWTEYQNSQASVGQYQKVGPLQWMWQNDSSMGGMPPNDNYVSGGFVSSSSGVSAAQAILNAANAKLAAASAQAQADQAALQAAAQKAASVAAAVKTTPVTASSQLVSSSSSSTAAKSTTTKTASPSTSAGTTVAPKAAPVVFVASSTTSTAPAAVQSLIKNSLSGTGSLSDSSPHVSSIQSNITKALAVSGLDSSTVSNLKSAQSALSSGNTAAAQKALSAALGGSTTYVGVAASSTAAKAATSSSKTASTAALTSAQSSVASAQQQLAVANASGTNQYGMTASQWDSYQSSQASVGQYQKVGPLQWMWQNDSSMGGMPPNDNYVSSSFKVSSTAVTTAQATLDAANAKLAQASAQAQADQAATASAYQAALPSLLAQQAKVDASPGTTKGNSGATSSNTSKGTVISTTPKLTISAATTIVGNAPNSTAGKLTVSKATPNTGNAPNSTAGKLTTSKAEPVTSAAAISTKGSLTTSPVSSASKSTPVTTTTKTTTPVVATTTKTLSPTTAVSSNSGKLTVSKAEPTTGTATISSNKGSLTIIPATTTTTTKQTQQTPTNATSASGKLTTSPATPITGVAAISTKGSLTVSSATPTTKQQQSATTTVAQKTTTATTAVGTNNNGKLTISKADSTSGNAPNANTGKLTISSGSSSSGLAPNANTGKLSVTSAVSSSGNAAISTAGKLTTSKAEQTSGNAAISTAGPLTIIPSSTPTSQTPIINGNSELAKLNRILVAKNTIPGGSSVVAGTSEKGGASNPNSGKVTVVSSTLTPDQATSSKNVYNTIVSTGSSSAREAESKTGSLISSTGDLIAQSQKSGTATNPNSNKPLVVSVTPSATSQSAVKASYNSTKTNKAGSNTPAIEDVNTYIPTNEQVKSTGVTTQAKINADAAATATADAQNKANRIAADFGVTTDKSGNAINQIQNNGNQDPYNSTVLISTPVGVSATAKAAVNTQYQALKTANKTSSGAKQDSTVKVAQLDNTQSYTRNASGTAADVVDYSNRAASAFGGNAGKLLTVASTTKTMNTVLSSPQQLVTAETLKQAEADLKKDNTLNAVAEYRKQGSVQNALGGAYVATQDTQALNNTLDTANANVASHLTALPTGDQIRNYVNTGVDVSLSPSPLVETVYKAGTSLAEKAHNITRNSDNPILQTLEKASTTIDSSIKSIVNPIADTVSNTKVGNTSFNDVISTVKSADEALKGGISDFIIDQYDYARTKPVSFAGELAVAYLGGAVLGAGVEGLSLVSRGVLGGALESTAARESASAILSEIAAASPKAAKVAETLGGAAKIAIPMAPKIGVDAYFTAQIAQGSAATIGQGYATGGSRGAVEATLNLAKDFAVAGAGFSKGAKITTSLASKYVPSVSTHSEIGMSDVSSMVSDIANGVKDSYAKSSKGTPTDIYGDIITPKVDNAPIETNIYNSQGKKNIIQTTKDVAGTATNTATSVAKATASTVSSGASKISDLVGKVPTPHDYGFGIADAVDMASEGLNKVTGMASDVKSSYAKSSTSAPTDVYGNPIKPTVEAVPKTANIWDSNGKQNIISTTKDAVGVAKYLVDEALPKSSTAKSVKSPGVDVTKKTTTTYTVDANDDVMITRTKLTPEALKALGDKGQAQIDKIKAEDQAKALKAAVNKNVVKPVTKTIDEITGEWKRQKQDIVETVKKTELYTAASEVKGGIQDIVAETKSDIARTFREPTTQKGTDFTSTKTPAKEASVTADVTDVQRAAKDTADKKNIVIQTPGLTTADRVAQIKEVLNDKPSITANITDKLTGKLSDTITRITPDSINARINKLAGVEAGEATTPTFNNNVTPELKATMQSVFEKGVNYDNDGFALTANDARTALMYTLNEMGIKTDKINLVDKNHKWDENKININIVPKDSGEFSNAWTHKEIDSISGKQRHEIYIEEGSDIVDIAHEIGHVISTVDFKSDVVSRSLSEANAENFSKKVIDTYKDISGIEKTQMSIYQKANKLIDDASLFVTSRPEHGIGYTLNNLGLVDLNIKPEFKKGYVKPTRSFNEKQVMAYELRAENKAALNQLRNKPYSDVRDTASTFTLGKEVEANKFFANNYMQDKAPASPDRTGDLTGLHNNSLANGSERMTLTDVENALKLASTDKTLSNWEKFDWSKPDSKYTELLNNNKKASVSPEDIKALDKRLSSTTVDAWDKAHSGEKASKNTGVTNADEILKSSPVLSNDEPITPATRGFDEYMKTKQVQDRVKTEAQNDAFAKTLEAAKKQATKDAEFDSKWSELIQSKEAEDMATVAARFDQKMPPTAEEIKAKARKEAVLYAEDQKLFDSQKAIDDLQIIKNNKLIHDTRNAELTKENVVLDAAKEAAKKEAAKKSITQPKDITNVAGYKKTLLNKGMGTEGRMSSGLDVFRRTSDYKAEVNDLVSNYNEQVDKNLVDTASAFDNTPQTLNKPKVEAKTDSQPKVDNWSAKEAAKVAQQKVADTLNKNKPQRASVDEMKDALKDLQKSKHLSKTIDVDNLSEADINEKYSRLILGIIPEDTQFWTPMRDTQARRYEENIKQHQEMLNKSYGGSEERYQEYMKTLNDRLKSSSTDDWLGKQEANKAAKKSADDAVKKAIQEKKDKEAADIAGKKKFTNYENPLNLDRKFYENGGKSPGTIDAEWNASEANPAQTEPANLTKNERAIRNINKALGYTDEPVEEKSLFDQHLDNILADKKAGVFDDSRMPKRPTLEMSDVPTDKDVYWNTTFEAIKNGEFDPTTFDSTKVMGHKININTEGAPTERNVYIHSLFDKIAKKEFDASEVDSKKLLGYEPKPNNIYTKTTRDLFVDDTFKDIANGEFKPDNFDWKKMRGDSGTSTGTSAGYSAFSDIVKPKDKYDASVMPGYLERGNNMYNTEGRNMYNTDAQNNMYSGSKNSMFSVKDTANDTINGAGKKTDTVGHVYNQNGGKNTSGIYERVSTDKENVLSVLNTKQKDVKQVFSVTDEQKASDMRKASDKLLSALDEEKSTPVSVEKKGGLNSYKEYRAQEIATRAANDPEYAKELKRIQKRNEAIDASENNKRLKQTPEEVAKNSVASANKNNLTPEELKILQKEEAIDAKREKSPVKVLPTTPEADKMADLVKNLGLNKDVVYKYNDTSGLKEYRAFRNTEKEIRDAANEERAAKDPKYAERLAKEKAAKIARNAELDRIHTTSAQESSNLESVLNPNRRNLTDEELKMLEEDAKYDNTDRTNEEAKKLEDVVKGLNSNRDVRYKNESIAGYTDLVRDNKKPGVSKEYIDALNEKLGKKTSSEWNKENKVTTDRSSIPDSGKNNGKKIDFQISEPSDAILSEEQAQNAIDLVNRKGKLFEVQQEKNLTNSVKSYQEYRAKENAAREAEKTARATKDPVYAKQLEMEKAAKASRNAMLETIHKPEVQEATAKNVAKNANKSNLTDEELKMLEAEEKADTTMIGGKKKIPTTPESEKLADIVSELNSNKDLGYRDEGVSGYKKLLSENKKSGASDAYMKALNEKLGKQTTAEWDKEHGFGVDKKSSSAKKSTKESGTKATEGKSELEKALERRRKTLDSSSSKSEGGSGGSNGLQFAQRAEEIKSEPKVEEAKPKTETKPKVEAKPKETPDTYDPEKFLDEFLAKNKDEVQRYKDTNPAPKAKPKTLAELLKEGAKKANVKESEAKSMEDLVKTKTEDASVKTEDAITKAKAEESQFGWSKSKNIESIIGAAAVAKKGTAKKETPVKPEVKPKQKPADAIAASITKTETKPKTDEEKAKTATEAKKKKKPEEEKNYASVIGSSSTASSAIAGGRNSDWSANGDDQDGLIYGFVPGTSGGLPGMGTGSTTKNNNDHGIGTTPWVGDKSKKEVPPTDVTKKVVPPKDNHGRDIIPNKPHIEDIVNPKDIDTPDTTPPGKGHPPDEIINPVIPPITPPITPPIVNPITPPITPPEIVPPVIIPQIVPPEIIPPIIIPPEIIPHPIPPQIIIPTDQIFGNPPPPTPDSSSLVSTDIDTPEKLDFRMPPPPLKGKVKFDDKKNGGVPWLKIKQAALVNTTKVATYEETMKSASSSGTDIRVTPFSKSNKESKTKTTMMQAMQNKARSDAVKQAKSVQAPPQQKQTHSQPKQQKQSPFTGKSNMPFTGKANVPSVGKSNASFTGKSNAPAVGKSNMESMISQKPQPSFNNQQKPTPQVSKQSMFAQQSKTPSMLTQQAKKPSMMQQQKSTMLDAMKSQSKGNPFGGNSKKKNLPF